MAGDGEAASYEAWIGRVFDDRYKLVRVLGEGGMGAVFVAEHLRLRKEVAFKIIRPEVAGDAQLAARFAQEAMVSAQIESPHIASAIDFGQLPEGGAYLVMQLARGRSLRSILGREGALPWPRAVEIAAQIADALVTAHSAGIVHRDLKPDNIIVGERDDGTPLVTVLDLGIAKRSAEAGPGQLGQTSAGEPLTGYGLVLGTPGYMAPEQAVGDRVDGRTDLYALGVILWECITGARLWSGASLTELVTRQLREPAPTIADARDLEVPEALEQIVAGLLARSPADRPAGAMAVRSALRGLITVTPADLAAAAPIGVGVGETASTPPGLSTAPGRPLATAPMTAAAIPPNASRGDRQILWVLAGCFVLGAIALAGLGTWYFGQGDRKNDVSGASRESAPDPSGKAGKAGKAGKKKRGRMSIHDDESPEGEGSTAGEGPIEGEGDEPVILEDKKGRRLIIPGRLLRRGGD